MAQLGINGPFLLAQIVNFIVLFLLLRRFLYPPLVKMLDERKQRIAEGLAAADVARKEAEEERAKLMVQITTERPERNSAWPRRRRRRSASRPTLLAMHGAKLKSSRRAR